MKKAIVADIKKGKRAIYVGNQLGGDPTPNTPKDLVLEFSYRGQRQSVTVPEGRTVEFPE